MTVTVVVYGVYFSADLLCLQFCYTADHSAQCTLLNCWHNSCFF